MLVQGFSGWDYMINGSGVGRNNNRNPNKMIITINEGGKLKERCEALRIVIPKCIMDSSGLLIGDKLNLFVSKKHNLACVSRENKTGYTICRGSTGRRPYVRFPINGSMRKDFFPVDGVKRYFTEGEVKPGRIEFFIAEKASELPINK